jgi:2-polyprenyl-6-hydroxyphenyl methylase/3-demethylubiquinone-9 3-methyltransferase
MGIDLSEEAIQRAKQLKHSKAHFEVANYEHWQPPGKFDIIIFNETLYYSDQPREVLRKYSRYLTSGGAIILSIHRFLNNERIWEQIDSDYTLVASDTVINRRGQTWDVRALRPHLSNRFFARWLRIIYTLRKLFSRRSSAKTG